MKNFPLALVAVAFVVVPVAFVEDRPPPKPTALESFLAPPTVVLDLAEGVGALENQDSSLAVFAILATDTAQLCRRRLRLGCRKPRSRRSPGCWRAGASSTPARRRKSRWPGPD